MIIFFFSFFFYRKKWLFDLIKVVFKQYPRRFSDVRKYIFFYDIYIRNHKYRNFAHYFVKQCCLRIIYKMLFIIAYKSEYHNWSSVDILLTIISVNLTLSTIFYATKEFAFCMMLHTNSKRIWQLFHYLHSTTFFKLHERVNSPRFMQNDSILLGVKYDLANLTSRR